MKLFWRKKVQRRVLWTVEPGMIGTTKDIQEKVKKLNKEMKRNNMHGYVKAQVQPLQYGMAQMLIWHGSC